MAIGWLISMLEIKPRGFSQAQGHVQIR